MITSAAHLPNGDILLDWIILLLALLVHFNLRNDRKPISKVQHCRSKPSQTNIDSPLFHVQAVRYVPFLDGRPEFNIPVLNGPLDPETRIQVIDALQGALQEIERQNIRLSAVEKELKVLKERQARRDEEAEWEDYDEVEGWEEGFEEDYEDYVDQSGDEFADDEDDLSIEDEEIKTAIITFDGKPVYGMPRVEEEPNCNFQSCPQVRIKDLATTRVTNVTSAYVYCN